MMETFTTPDPGPQPGDLALKFGEALEAARGDTPQRAQARALGWTAATVRELERGLANPTLRRVEDVAEAYGLEVDLVVRPRRRGRSAS